MEENRVATKSVKRYRKHCEKCNEEHDFRMSDTSQNETVERCLGCGNKTYKTKEQTKVL